MIWLTCRRSMWCLLLDVGIGGWCRFLDRRYRDTSGRVNSRGGRGAGTTLPHQAWRVPSFRLMRMNHPANAGRLRPLPRGPTRYLPMRDRPWGPRHLGRLASNSESRSGGFRSHVGRSRIAGAGGALTGKRSPWGQIACSATRLRGQDAIMGCLGGLIRRFVQGWLIARVMGWLRGRGEDGGDGRGGRKRRSV